MKKHYFLLVLAAALSFSLVACNDDDDDDNKKPPVTGTPEITLPGGNTVEFGWNETGTDKTVAVTLKDVSEFSYDLKYQEGDDWLDISKESVALLIRTKTSNRSEEKRSAVLTISAEGAASKTVTITQVAEPVVPPTPELKFKTEDGTASRLTLDYLATGNTTNTVELYVVETGNIAIDHTEYDWIEASLNGEKITVKVKDWEQKGGSSRTGYIVVSADDVENITLTVNQAPGLLVDITGLWRFTAWEMVYPDVTAINAIEASKPDFTVRDLAFYEEPEQVTGNVTITLEPGGLYGNGYFKVGGFPRGYPQNQHLIVEGVSPHFELDIDNEGRIVYKAGKNVFESYADSPFRHMLYAYTIAVRSDNGQKTAFDNQHASWTVPIEVSEDGRTVIFPTYVNGTEIGVTTEYWEGDIMVRYGWHTFFNMGMTAAYPCISHFRDLVLTKR